MSSNAHRPAGTGIAVGEVAAEAYRSVFGRLGLFLDLAWLPLLLMLAAALIPGLVSSYLMPETAPAASGGAGFDIGVGDLAEAVIAMLCLNAFAVRWHHAVLFPDPHRVGPGIFRRAWARFLLYTLIFNVVLAALSSGTIVVASASGALAAPGDVGNAPLLFAAFAGAALTIALMIGMMRCALLLPAAAFGQPLGAVAAWQRLRGNTWRLIGCVIMACLPALVSALLLLNGLLAAARIDATAVFASGEMPLGAFILHGVVGTVSNFVTVALAASVLSGFYRRIVLRSGAI